MRPTTRTRDIICICVLCALTFLTWIPRSRGPIDLRWDAGVYYVLGTSIAEGRGYRLLNEPGEIRDIQYPPLLPAIVALHQKILGTTDQVVVGRWLRVTWIFLSLIYVALAFIVGRMFLPIGYAFAMAVVCAMAFEMYFLSTLLFTELPFGVATTLFAVLCCRKEPGRLSQAGAGASAIAAYLLRTIGIAALAAWVFDALLKKRFRVAAIRGAVALVPIVMWQGYVQRVQSSDEYKHPRYAYQRDSSMFYNVSYASNVALKDPFQPELGRASPKDLVLRFLDNVRAAPGELGSGMGGRRDFWYHQIFELPGVPHLAENPMWVGVWITEFLIAALTLAGIVLLLWRRRWAIGLYVVLSLMALGTSPWPQQTARYFAPLLPFFFVAMFGCVEWLTGLARSVRYDAVRVGSRLAAVYISVFVVVGSVLSYTPTVNNYLFKTTYKERDGANRPYTLVWFPASFIAFHSALGWLKQHASPNEIAAVSMPHWTYLETGLQSVMTPFQEAPATAERLLESVPASYVILETTGSYNTHLPDQIRSSPDKWERVFASDPSGAEVYRRVRQDTRTK